MRKKSRKPHPSIAWSWNAIAIITARTLFSLGLIPHTIYWVDYLVRGLGNNNSFGGLHWTLFGIGAICGTYLWGRLADRIGFHIALPLAFTIVASGIALPVLIHENWVLIISSLIVGAQPGLTAILSGRVHQLMGKDKMPVVWRAALWYLQPFKRLEDSIRANFCLNQLLYTRVSNRAAFMGTGAIIAWTMREENH